jgi:hypothetical protein
VIVCGRRCGLSGLHLRGKLSGVVVAGVVLGRIRRRSGRLRLLSRPGGDVKEREYKAQPYNDYDPFPD